MFSYKSMQNRVFASSSNITDNISCIDKLFHYGIAGVITKTIASLQDRESTGRIWKKNRILYNSTGYSGKGLNTWIKILDNYRQKDKLVIPSIYSADREELAEMMSILQQTGVPAIEMGISCPNDEGKNAIQMAGHVARAMEGIEIPVYIKLCSQGEVQETMKEFYDMGVAGFVLSDSFPGFVNEMNNRRAGVSGEGIRPYVLQSIAAAREQGINCEIVGTGGIFSKEHITQYLRAGADAVGLCSCMYIYGIDCVKNLLDEEGDCINEKRSKTIL